MPCSHLTQQRMRRFRPASQERVLTVDTAGHFSLRWGRRTQVISNSIPNSMITYAFSYDTIPKAISIAPSCGHVKSRASYAFDAD